MSTRKDRRSNDHTHEGLANLPPTFCGEPLKFLKGVVEKHPPFGPAEWESTETATMYQGLTTSPALHPVHDTLTTILANKSVTHSFDGIPHGP